MAVMAGNDPERGSSIAGRQVPWSVSTRRPGSVVGLSPGPRLELRMAAFGAWAEKGLDDEVSQAACFSIEKAVCGIARTPSIAPGQSCSVPALGHDG